MQQSAKKLEMDFRDKKVLVTGHTGFKGSWLCEWLLSLGANVVGISLEPQGEPSLFEQLKLQDRLEHHIQDIRDAEKVAEIIAETQPDMLFHLAAQALVRYSYEHPIETIHTNTLGTAHVLNALRGITKPCSAVFITSDKCYENKEQREPYGEDDRMGGYDPYSVSKAASELIISSFRRSYFNPSAYGTSHQIALASARAGNVIGGGDWAVDRIVPDCMKTLARGEPIPVRSPSATRPWQHVLEPLGGYLTLAAHLCRVTDPDDRASLCTGFNFGPDPRKNYSVQELVEKIITCWPGSWEDHSDTDAPHEAGLLNLAIEKAKQDLDWEPVWGFDDGVEQTAHWYRAVLEDPAIALDVTRQQIRDYMEKFSHAI